MSKLTEALYAKDIRNIKSSIISYLTADPLDKSGEIKKAIATIDANGIAAWQPHDEDTPLYTDTSNWTKEYFADLQAHLVTNFSKPSLELALKVGRHAYREELNRQKQPVRTTQSTYSSQNRSGNDDMGKILVAGAAVIAVGIVIYILAK